MTTTKIEVMAGENITSFARRLTVWAPSSGVFNDVELFVSQDDKIDDVVSRYFDALAARALVQGSRPSSSAVLGRAFAALADVKPGRPIGVAMSSAKKSESVEVTCMPHVTSIDDVAVRCGQCGHVQRIDLPKTSSSPYDHRANDLADKLTDMRRQNEKILAENASLRMKLEDAERALAKKGMKR